ncbi:sugar O-acetyltransferase [Methanobrevibacter boviskoreani]|uniref:sugar O-acetyltransferase n=1 Tax=Methanobrevibacter boviskoreani TaxID=1348249 RepID=UPI0023F52913|nr:sugar O-acetyltransferase [Methanobrevibacter boviskoreani]MDD6256633.1 sugar O-acetyltransferase [Methanobrevibacter boviskoreani]
MIKLRKDIKLDKGNWTEQGDKDLVSKWKKSKRLNFRLNHLKPDENIERINIQNELFKFIGPNAVVATPFYCDLGFNTSIGEGSLINSNCVFLDTDDLTIGKYTLIGSGVHIYCADHLTDTKLRVIPKDDKLNDGNYSYIDGKGRFDEDMDYTITVFSRPVSIGDNCWIGGGSIIMSGVKIGDNVIVGAGSVVTHDIPSNTTVIGRPARIINKD